MHRMYDHGKSVACACFTCTNTAERQDVACTCLHMYKHGAVCGLCMLRMHEHS